jgi:LuxR family maltose regulon positive regulatory protein
MSEIARGDERMAHSEAAASARLDGSALVEFKLDPPHARREWVERRELIDRLDQASSRLILLAAPAGYGKTTLLAQWYSRAGDGRSFAWVSLDEDDNDATALWQLVTLALVRPCPTPGLKSLARAAQGEMPTRSEILLPGLVRELNTLARPVTIVLDGYDAIKNRECHQQLKFLLARLPSRAQIALSVRSRTPLTLARMRVRGDMTEFGPGDLSMTAEDAAQLIRGLCGATLGKQDLSRLIECTEGWPAGVYLMGLSLCMAPDRSDFIRRCTGGNRYIWDFLTEEVINHQPPHIQQFLLRTSVLERFTASLCEAVTGSSNASEIIEILDSENVFLTPLDDHREWFRYHQLFSQALLRQLTVADPDAVPALRLRASAWHRQRRLPGRAINCALAADSARQELMHALALRRGSPGLSPWPRLEILLRLAPLLQDLGDVAGAAALLGEAEDLLAFFPDGAQAQLVRLNRLQRLLGESVDVTSAPQRLTPREQTVLQWLGGTLSLREIGKELYVSANTVKTHTRAIYRKLGVGNRRDAIDRGRELGIL